MKLAPLLTLVPLLAVASPLNLSGPYVVQIDVYVRNERVLCSDAWKVAEERLGAGLGAAMTMTNGVDDVKKCLAVLYQTAAVGDQVVSYGIYVRSKP